jgi:hypothetical protein
MDADHPYCTPGLKLYQSLLETDRAARLATQARLRTLKREHGPEVLIFCAHDLKELEALQSVGPIAAPETRPRAWRAEGRKPRTGEPAVGRRGTDASGGLPLQ